MREATSHQLDIFDYVTLILIMAIWLLVLRFSLIFAVTTVSCVEQFANFGRTASLPYSVFEIATLTTSLLGVFWILIAIRRFRVKQSMWTWAAWHGVVLIAILILWTACLSLTSNQALKPPDGILNTRPVIKTTANGETIYETERHFLARFAEWERGNVSYQTEPKCVWLDESLVMDYDIQSVENYEAYSRGETLYHQQPYLMPRPEKLTLSNLAAQSGFSIFGKRAIDYLQKKQVYRPLSARERERFLIRQACLADISNYGKPAKHCQFFWTIDYDAAREAGVYQ